MVPLLCCGNDDGPSPLLLPLTCFWPVSHLSPPCLSPLCFFENCFVSLKTVSDNDGPSPLLLPLSYFSHPSLTDLSPHVPCLCLSHLSGLLLAFTQLTQLTLSTQFTEPIHTRLSHRSLAAYPLPVSLPPLASFSPSRLHSIDSIDSIHSIH
jgi:hypothetical protein